MARFVRLKTLWINVDAIAAIQTVVPASEGWIPGVVAVLVMSNMQPIGLFEPDLELLKVVMGDAYGVCEHG